MYEHEANLRNKGAGSTAAATDLGWNSFIYSAGVDKTHNHGVTHTNLGGGYQNDCIR